MTSIFTEPSFFQKQTEQDTCNDLQGHYSFGKPAFLPNQASNALDQHLGQKQEFQRECGKYQQNPRIEDQQMSLFVDNLIFEDKNTNECEEGYDQETCAQIENTILNMLDDEPLEILHKFEQNDEKEQETSPKRDMIGEELEKTGSPRSDSPLALSTQASNDNYSPSIFSASSGGFFNSPSCCQPNLAHDVQISDFSSFLCEGTPSVAEKPSTQMGQSVQKERQASSYDFPDGGWACGQCSNYNFKGRSQCYRCKKEKDQNDTQGKPKHMSMCEGERAAMKAVKQSKRQQKAKKRGPKSPSDQGEDSGQGKVRPGDWSCYRCQNFNYSFRDVCNKCGLFQHESNYYSMNYAPNAIEWNNMNMQPQLNQFMSYNPQLQQQQMYHQQQNQQYYYPQQQVQQPMSTFTNMNAYVPQNLQQQQQQFA